MSTWSRQEGSHGEVWERGFWKPGETRTENLPGVQWKTHPIHPLSTEVRICTTQNMHSTSLRALHSAGCSCQSCVVNITFTLHPRIASPCCPRCQQDTVVTAMCTKGWLKFRNHLSGEKKKNLSRIIFNDWLTSWAVLLCTKDPRVERTLAHR